MTPEENIILIIAGGRNYELTHTDYWRLDYIHKKHNVVKVLSGGASGADKCGEAWAKLNKIPVQVFKADWKKHGKAAGPIRNKAMAEHADALIAFPGGKGTDNMIHEAELRKLVLYDHSDNEFNEDILLRTIFGEH